MATYTDYADDESGNAIYAKPEPIVASPWSTGVVNGVENGTTGSFAFSLNTELSYIVYRRAGGSPASSDIKLGRFSKNVEMDSLTEITKIPRRTTAIAAGAQYTRTNTSESPTEVITEVLS